jgi:AcrR family transcriptional regulator
MRDSTTESTEARVAVRAAIVKAAARLLHEGGSAAVTTRAVAHAAGVQAPAIYRLFGDKDGLIDAVAEHAMATYVASKAGSAAQDPVDDLRAGWQQHLEFGLANPHLYAILNDPRRGEPSPATLEGIQVLRERVHRVAAAGRLRVEEERAVEMIHAAGSGTLLALLEQSPGSRDIGLADAMFDAVSARILTDAPSDGTSDGTSDHDELALLVTFAAAAPTLEGLSDAEAGLLSEWIARAIRAKRA